MDCLSFEFFRWWWNVEDENGEVRVVFMEGFFIFKWDIDVVVREDNRERGIILFYNILLYLY